LTFLGRLRAAILPTRIASPLPGSLPTRTFGLSAGEVRRLVALRNVQSWLGGERRIRALARTENRGRLHAILLLVGAALVMLASLGMDLFDDPPAAADKARHYHGGRIAAGIAFYLAYMVIILRLLVANRVHGSLTRRLLWIPAVLSLGLVAALLGILGLSVVKEAFDFTGSGNVEWLDVEVGLRGALSLVLPIALIMALTPILIPLDLLLQLPRMSRRRTVHTGIHALDGYLQAQEYRNQLEKPPDVMLVEDDIVSATTVITFCRNLHLKCHHVSTIAEANFHLRHSLPHLRLIILDNFLRVGDTGDNTTGGQWLTCISREFPPDSRPFRVVIISGYPEYLGDAAPLADLILRKPWSPNDLTLFMAHHQIGQIPDTTIPSGESALHARKRVRRYYSRRRPHRRRVEHQPTPQSPDLSAASDSQLSSPAKSEVSHSKSEM
jgi:hypothetical protein